MIRSTRVVNIVFNLKIFPVVFLVTEGCVVHAFATLLNHLLSFFQVPVKGPSPCKKGRNWP